MLPLCASTFKKANYNNSSSNNNSSCSSSSRQQQQHIHNDEADDENGAFDVNAAAGPHQNMPIGHLKLPHICCTCHSLNNAQILVTLTCPPPPSAAPALPKAALACPEFEPSP
jgi:hypothetical protein